MYKFTIFLLMVHFAWAFIDIYETEHAQHQIAEEINEMGQISKAKQLIDKMKDGVGGTTVAIHHPSRKQFIHRNKWILSCHGKISQENGHCNGDAMESLIALKPKEPSEFCYIKGYNVINDTLCLSTHPVKMHMENDSIKCDSISGLFPTFVVTIDDYLKLCEGVSGNVTYIYYANSDDPEHVEIPNENTHVKCDNEFEEEENNQKRKKIKSLEFAVNKTGVCIFTENDKTLLKLLEYLQL